MQPLVPLIFHNLPSLYPLHLEETIFILVILLFGCANAPSTIIIGAKKRFALYMQLSFPSSLFAITVDTYFSLFSFFFRYAARGDRTRTASLRRYATNRKVRERYLWGFGAPLVVSRRVIKHCLCISREICTVPSLY